MPRGFDANDDRFRVKDRIREVGRKNAERDFRDATFGKGPMAGKTGNPFKDDPRFNPWAKGGSFDKSSRKK